MKKIGTTHNVPRNGKKWEGTTVQGKRTHIFPNRYFQLFRTHLPGLRLEPLRFNPVLDLLLLLGLHPLCGTSYCTIFQIDSSFSFSQFPPTRNGQLVNANRLTLAQNCNKQATQERSLFLHKTEALIPFGHCSCTIIVKKKAKMCNLLNCGTC